MSKSSLIIDTPETCSKCPLHIILPYKKLGICLGYNPNYVIMEKDVNKMSICPLKPLPEPIPPERADYAHEASYIKGWNDCLEKILENK